MKHRSYLSSSFAVATLALLGIAATASAQSGPVWSYGVADQQAEEDTYDNVLNWTWTASDKQTEFSSTFGGPSGSGNNVHSYSEADDLWAHYQMYRRTGNSTYLTWAQGWRDYYVNGHYRSDLDSSGESSNWLYDHLYGWGLVVWAHYENDPAALAEAENLAARLETFVINRNVTPGSTPVAYWGSRGMARHLLLAVYVAEKTQSARWIALRDLLIDTWVQSPDWTTGQAGGNYFMSRENMGAASLSGGDYDNGMRANSAFQIGTHVEAMWRAYLATGRADVRDKLIAMAQWAEYYAHDPAYVNPMVGAWLGQRGDLSRWHRDRDSGNANVKGTDPAYDTALVNTLVIGYKFTGSTSMLNLARTLFRNGTIFSPGPANAPPSTKLVADDEVHHYVDTLTDPSNVLFEYNKGELQYTYLLFENGGNPVVMGVAPNPPRNLTTN